MHGLALRFLTAVICAGCGGCALFDPACRTPNPSTVPAATEEIRFSGRQPLTSTPPEGLGFADYHAHMFSNLAFGGVVFAGQPYSTETKDGSEINAALAPCQHTCQTFHLPTHFVVTDLEPDHPHDGAPDLYFWPRYTSMLHQQMYIDWVYRAYEHGLRLVVVTVTNNQTLCAAVQHVASCRDMDVIEAQMAALKEMVSRERAWMELATTPNQAQQIIEHNRLAIVAGVEVDTLFDCADQKVTCDFEHDLDHVYDIGVRQLTPIHLSDNGFGGFALYDERLAANELSLRGVYPQPEPCMDPDIAWTLRGGSAIPFLLKLGGFLTSGHWYAPAYPQVSAHCNSLGLTGNGRRLIQAMMARGMLIDLEHMSDRATRDTLDIVKKDYPVLLSHTWIGRTKFNTKDIPTEANQLNDLRSEMHRSDDILEKVLDSGGVIGLLTNQGFVRTVKDSTVEDSKVLNNCQTSSRSFAQALHWAHHLARGRPAIGLGTDINGLAGQPSPRFGVDACRWNQRETEVGTERARERLAQHLGGRVRYDLSETIGGKKLTLYQLGHIDMDYNVVGLAHYGLIPDFLVDLRAVGVPDEQITPLFGSAMAYVDMWKRAELFRTRVRAPTP